MDLQQPFYPGRYAAIEVGSNSVLLLVADVDVGGCLTPVEDGEEVTRLSEQSYVSRRLTRPARDRTLDVICEFIRTARASGADGIAAVGTSILREAKNGADFQSEVRQACGLPIEVISGEQEAELAYCGNLHDRRLPGVDGERVVIDIGGGSTEVVRGVGSAIHSRASYPLGAVRLTELFLRGDPPGVRECDAADLAIETVLAPVEPMPPASVVLGSGGTLYHMASTARAAGMAAGADLHGLLLPHKRVAELVDLFRSLPLKFRKRVPGLEPQRADVILAGAMIAHQLMARLSAPRITITGNGVRHGCIYAMAQRALQKK